ncbi:hypothetical protein FB564_2639 [Salinispora arenicola]|uniref:Uncharacterized protein n=1 Tax=Salinispora arenicola TaxID=168697 RepID=A0A542XNQ3_SALAC|nr:hypothetical protein FB564_2639 [Salinispora arenicola]
MSVAGVWLMSVWGVVGGMVVVESRRVSGRYTVRTAEEAARLWVGVAGAWAPPGMVAARRSLHRDPAPCEPLTPGAAVASGIIFFSS